MNILNLLPIIVAASGLFLLIKLRFFFILHPKRTFSALKSATSNKGAFSSLCLSLAGTLGVGNIVGVAFGISVGGKGCVFWLFISSIFSLVLKFSEATLASDKKLSSGSGMIDVIKSSFPKRLVPLSFIYAFLCLLLSLSMGAALQARAAVESLVYESRGEIVPALIFAVLVAVAIFGGAKRIEKITAKLIPFAAILYIVLCLGVIILKIEYLPSLILEILRDAFSAKAALGGVGAFFIITKMKEGFSRGLLSNEAGAGTSAFAHTRNENNSPVSVGLVGMCEVFFDTVVLCMLTSFAVLLAVPAPENYSSGIEIVKIALSILGKFSAPLLALSIFAFAYSTVICWYYYGKCALSYLTQKGGRVFSIIFIFSVFFGAVTPSGYLIVISDYLLFFLCLISLSAVIKNSDRLVFLSENEGLLQKANTRKNVKR